MSGLRSRHSHFVLSATVITVACAGLAVPACEARDGRSRTSVELIVDMPGPKDHDSEHLILEMPPMHPVRAARLPVAQERKEAESLTAQQKPARTAGRGSKATAKTERAGQPSTTAPPAPPVATAPATPNVAEAPAASAASAAQDAKVSQEMLRPGFDFDAAARLTPETLGAVAANAPASSEAAPPPFETHDDASADGGASLVANLKPAAEQPSPFAVSEAPEEASSIGLDAKPNFAIVQQMALGEDTLAPNTPNELAETIALKAASDADVAEKSSSIVNVAAAAPAPSTPAQSQSGDVAVSASVPSTFFYPRVQRIAGARAQSGSALSREIEQVANSVPPIQFEMPRGAEEQSGATPPAMRPRQFSGGFQWRMPSLEAKPKEDSEEKPAAEANKPDVDDSAAARKAEQERKDAVWARVAKAQADAKAKAAAQAQKDPDADNQLPVFRVIKKLMHPEARNDEERAYAAMLKEGVKGPIRVRLADRATLWLPSGYVYIDAERARDVMDGEAGLTDPNNQGVILPETRTPTWMAYVDLLDDGYVADENAKNMNAASLLLGLKTSVGNQNAERSHYGVAPLTIDRWIKTPQYAAAKHDVDACVSAVDASAADPGGRLVNCFSYALGRRGAVKILVTGEESNLAAFEHEASGLTEHITYDQGRAYRDYVAGQDAVAEYGAAELVGGVVGLKSIVAVAAAAGAGKNQELFLTRVLSYWEEILTALIVVVLAVRWLQENRSEEQEEEEDLRATPRVSFFRHASSRLGATIRGLFETEEVVQPGAAKQVAAGAAKQGAEQNAKSAAAEKKSLVAALRETAAKLPLPMLRKAAKDAAAPPVGEADEKIEGTPAAVASSAPAVKRAGWREKIAALPVLAKFAKSSAPAAAAAATAATTPASKGRRGAEVETSAVEPVAENVGASANKLSKLASIMRKKAEEPAAPVAVSRVATKREAAPLQPAIAAPAPAASAAPKPAPAATAAPEPARAPRPEPALSTSVADILDLVEPGDAQASTIAREALQQAHG